jgi:hypothetical protein
MRGFASHCFSLLPWPSCLPLRKLRARVHYSLCCPQPARMPVLAVGIGCGHVDRLFRYGLSLADRGLVHNAHTHRSDMRPFNVPKYTGNGRGEIGI